MKKFRGVDRNTGKLVYGAYDDYTGQILTYDYTEDGQRVVVDVDLLTVSQMVGYDIDGNELYEGDTVIRNGRPVTLKVKVHSGNEELGDVGFNFRVEKQRTKVHRTRKQRTRRHQQEDRFTWKPEDLVVFKTEKEYREYIKKPFPEWKDW